MKQFLLELLNLILLTSNDQKSLMLAYSTIKILLEFENPFWTNSVRVFGGVISDQPMFLFYLLEHIHHGSLPNINSHRFFKEVCLFFFSKVHCFFIFIIWLSFKIKFCKLFVPLWLRGVKGWIVYSGCWDGGLRSFIFTLKNRYGLCIIHVELVSIIVRGKNTERENWFSLFIQIHPIPTIFLL